MTTIRAFTAADEAAVRALALPEIERSRYPSGARSAIEALIRRTDPDARAALAVDGGRAVGLILFGSIAGSLGAGRIQLIVTDASARRGGIATSLVHASLEMLRRDGARFALVELPDDPALAPSHSLLGRCGFHIESRVRDFFRDGVDLLLLRRDLTSG